MASSKASVQNRAPLDHISTQDNWQRMPDRTREFREVLEARQRQASSSISRDAPSPARVDALRRLRKRKRAHAEPVNTNDPDLDVWSLEAGRVVDSLRSLALFLSSIRRAYLDLSSSSSSHSQYRNSKGKGPAGGREDLDLSKGLLEAWKDVKWLNDRERDEVDWQAKDMLRKCMERLKALEQAEKSACIRLRGSARLIYNPIDRHTKAKQQLGINSANNFTRFLGLPPVLSNQAERAEDQLNAHRQQVILFLSRRLADVGRIQHEQQEIRVARQLERQNLSTSSAAAANRALAQAGDSGKGKGKGLDDGVPDIFVPAPITTGYDSDEGGMDGFDAPIDSLLSKEQIQQFESESSALLQEANSQLAAIEKAQSSLLEISTLQSELAIHLTQQMEITDQLWEDSVLVSGRVDEGNKQLVKARERNREGRLWLLIFLVGASLSLLWVISVPGRK